MKNKIMVVLAAVVLCAAAAIAIVVNMKLEDTMDTMEFIAGRYRGGVFIDYDHSINVESAKDIGYWNKGTTWYVKFGKLQLKFTKENLKDPAYLEAIAAIGLDVRGNLEDNNLRWYWCGEQLEEWVPN